MKLSVNHVNPYTSRTLPLFCSVEFRSLLL